MSKVLNEFYILFTSESKKLREDFAQVKKSTEEIKKTLKESSEINDKTKNSFSDLAKTVFDTAAAFSTLSSINKFSSNLGQVRKELYLTAQQTGVAASQIQALEDTFQFYGVQPGLLQSQLKSIQKAAFDITGLNLDPKQAIFTLNDYLPELRKKLGNVSVENALSSIGISPELSLGFRGQETTKKYNDYLKLSQGFDNTAALQQKLDQTKKDLNEAFQGLYNTYVTPIELSMAQSLFNNINEALNENVKKPSEATGIALGILGAAYGTLFDNNRTLIENLRDLTLTTWGLIGVVPKLLAGFAAMTPVLAGLLAVVEGFKAYSSFKQANTQAEKVGGWGNLFSNVKSRVGTDFWKNFLLSFNQNEEKKEYVKNSSVNYTDSFKPDLKALPITDLQKQKLQTIFPNINPIIPPSNYSNATKPAANVNVKVDNINVTAKTDASLHEIAHVTKETLQKHIDFSFVNYLSPVLI